MTTFAEFDGRRLSLCLMVAIVPVVFPGCLGRNYDRSLTRITIPDRYESPTPSNRDATNVIYVVEQPNAAAGATQESSSDADQHRGPRAVIRTNPNWTAGHPNVTNANQTQSNLTYSNWTQGNLTLGGGRVTFSHPGITRPRPHQTFVQPNISQPRQTNTTRSAPTAPRVRLRINPNITR